MNNLAKEGLDFKCECVGDTSSKLISNMTLKDNESTLLVGFTCSNH